MGRMSLANRGYFVTYPKFNTSVKFWIVGLLFPIMTSKMPQEFAFAILRGICFTSVIFVPETKKAIR